MILRIRELGRTFWERLQAYRAIATDPRTPWYARWLLGAAVGYTLLPFDLIPDWLPLVGHLDDVLIVPALVWFGLRAVPPEVVADYL